MRFTELVAKLERQTPTGFHWQKEDTSQSRVTVFQWTTPDLCDVEYRRQISVPPNELPPRGPEGYTVYGEDFTRRRLRSGREVNTQCHHTLTFRPVGYDMTRVSSFHDHHKTGVSWWETALPPVVERRIFRIEFRKTADLCDNDLSMR